MIYTMQGLENDHPIREMLFNLLPTEIPEPRGHCTGGCRRTGRCCRAGGCGKPHSRVLRARRETDMRGKTCTDFRRCRADQARPHSCTQKRNF